MASATGEEPLEMSRENLRSFIREHEEPVVTAKDVAEAFDITTQAANYRLRQLKDEGKVEDKKVGASAKVWYLIG